MAETAFKIVGLPELRQTVSKHERLLKHPGSGRGSYGGKGGPFHRSVIYLDGWIQRNFKQEGKLAMGGSGWEPLKPSTLRKIAGTARGGAGKKQVLISHRPKILQDTGKLRMSWRHDYNDKEAIIENYATAGNKNYYYGYAHQEGKGHLPVRRIIPEREQVESKIQKIFKLWIREVLNR